MCYFKKNLIAWMDGELPAEEAAAMEQHLQTCTECYEGYSRYSAVSDQFAAHYFANSETIPSMMAPRHIPDWLPYLAVAAAILAVTFAVSMRAPKHSSTDVTASNVASQSSIAAETTVQPQTVAIAPKAAVRHVAARQKAQTPNLVAAQPTIRVAIPADSIFPPGAVPEGLAYIAHLAPDGSLQELRLQP